jgi:hypothetical protein
MGYSILELFGLESDITSLLLFLSLTLRPFVVVTDLTFGGVMQGAVPMGERSRSEGQQRSWSSGYDRRLPSDGPGFNSRRTQLLHVPKTKFSFCLKSRTRRDEIAGQNWASS